MEEKINTIYGMLDSETYYILTEKSNEIGLSYPGLKVH